MSTRFSVLYVFKLLKSIYIMLGDNFNGKHIKLLETLFLQVKHKSVRQKINIICV